VAIISAHFLFHVLTFCARDVIDRLPPTSWCLHSWKLSLTLFTVTPPPTRRDATRRDETVSSRRCRRRDELGTTQKHRRRQMRRKCRQMAAADATEVGSCGKPNQCSRCERFQKNFSRNHEAHCQEAYIPFWCFESTR